MCLLPYVIRERKMTDVIDSSSGSSSDITTYSVADLIASLDKIRAASQAFLIATTRAAAAESALSIATLELDSATCAIEEAGRSLNSTLRTAAMIASRGGAEAACAVLDPSGVLLDKMRNAGASFVDNDARNSNDPVAAAKTLVRETVMSISSTSSSHALTLGVLLSTLALQADLNHDNVTTTTPVRVPVIDNNNNKRECASGGDVVLGLVSSAATRLEQQPPIHTTKSSSTRVSRSIVNQRSPRGVNPREWTITMPGAVSATPSSPLFTQPLASPLAPPLPFTHSPTTTAVVAIPSSPPPSSPSPSLQKRASTPVRLAMRAATDLCTTAAGAVAALDAAAVVTKGGALNSLKMIHPAAATPNTALLSSVPRFAGALASALSGGKEATETATSLTRLRAMASDHVELTRQRGTQVARSALGSVRGSLSVELNLLTSSSSSKPPPQMDQVAVLAGLSADLIAIEKLLQSTAQ